MIKELALISSIAIIIILLIRRVDVGLSILAGTLFYGFVTFGLDAFSTILSAFNETMFNTVFTLLLALFLSELMVSMRLSPKIIKGLSTFGPRFAAVGTPALIGLLPMSGGAYVSATMVKPLYDKMGLNGEESTFVNYWFRHLWVIVWPLYQGVILAAGILSVPISRIVEINWPIFVMYLIGGLLLALTILKKRGTFEREPAGLVHLWPFILIAILTVYLKMTAWISTLITVVVFSMVYRPKISDFKAGLKFALNFSILVAVISSLIFNRLIQASKIVVDLFNVLVQWKYIMGFLLPFIVSLSTGSDFAFIAIALPMLAPVLLEGEAMLVFAGGLIGLMLSPAHPCLVLSAKYFKAEIPKVYKYLLPAAVLTTLFLLVFFFIFT